MVIAGVILLAVIIKTSFLAAFTRSFYKNRDPIYMSNSEVLIATGKASFIARIAFFFMNLFIGLFYPRNLIEASIFVGLTYLIGYFIEGNLEWVF